MKRGNVIFCLLVFSILSLFLIQGVYAGGMNCSDSDNASNPFIKGTVTLADGTTYTDTCSSNDLKEYYCESSFIPIAKEYLYNCDRCYEGQCIYCTDSDNGKDYYKNGSAVMNFPIGEITTNKDYCDGNDLLEAFCFASPSAGTGYERVTCPAAFPRCIQGACTNRSLSVPTIKISPTSPPDHNFDLASPVSREYEIVQTFEIKAPDEQDLKIDKILFEQDIFSPDQDQRVIIYKDFNKDGAIEDVRGPIDLLYVGLPILHDFPDIGVTETILAGDTKNYIVAFQIPWSFNAGDNYTTIIRGASGVGQTDLTRYNLNIAQGEGNTSILRIINSSHQNQINNNTQTDSSNQGSAPTTQASSTSQQTNISQAQEKNISANITNNQEIPNLESETNEDTSFMSRNRKYFIFGGTLVGLILGILIFNYLYAKYKKK